MVSPLSKHCCLDDAGMAVRLAVDSPHHHNRVFLAVLRVGKGAGQAHHYHLVGLTVHLLQQNARHYNYVTYMYQQCCTEINMYTYS